MQKAQKTKKHQENTFKLGNMDPYRENLDIEANADVDANGEDDIGHERLSPNKLFAALGSSKTSGSILKSQNGSNNLGNGECYSHTKSLSWQASATSKGNLENEEHYPRRGNPRNLCRLKPICRCETRDLLPTTTTTTVTNTAIPISAPAHATAGTGSGILAGYSSKADSISSSSKPILAGMIGQKSDKCIRYASTRRAVSTDSSNMACSSLKADNRLSKRNNQRSVDMIKNRWNDSINHVNTIDCTPRRPQQSVISVIPNESLILSEHHEALKIKHNEADHQIPLISTRFDHLFPNSSPSLESMPFELGMSIVKYRNTAQKARQSKAKGDNSPLDEVFDWSYCYYYCCSSGKIQYKNTDISQSTKAFDDSVNIPDLGISEPRCNTAYTGPYLRLRDISISQFGGHKCSNDFLDDTPCKNEQSDDREALKTRILDQEQRPESIKKVSKDNSIMGESVKPVLEAHKVILDNEDKPFLKVHAMENGQATRLDLTKASAFKDTAGFLWRKPSFFGEGTPFSHMDNLMDQSRVEFNANSSLNITPFNQIVFTATSQDRSTSCSPDIKCVHAGDDASQLLDFINYSALAPSAYHQPLLTYNQAPCGSLFNLPNQEVKFCSSQKAHEEMIDRSNRHETNKGYGANAGYEPNTSHEPNKDHEPRLMAIPLADIDLVNEENRLNAFQIDRISHIRSTGSQISQKDHENFQGKSLDLLKSDKYGDLGDFQANSQFGIGVSRANEQAYSSDYTQNSTYLPFVNHPKIQYEMKSSLKASLPYDQRLEDSKFLAHLEGCFDTKGLNSDDIPTSVTFTSPSNIFIQDYAQQLKSASLEEAEKALIKDPPTSGFSPESGVSEHKPKSSASLVPKYDQRLLGAIDVNSDAKYKPELLRRPQEAYSGSLNHDKLDCDVELGSSATITSKMSFTYSQNSPSGQSKASENACLSNTFITNSKEGGDIRSQIACSRPSSQKRISTTNSRDLLYSQDFENSLKTPEYRTSQQYFFMPKSISKSKVLSEIYEQDLLIIKETEHSLNAYGDYERDFQDLANALTEKPDRYSRRVSDLDNMKYIQASNENLESGLGKEDRRYEEIKDKIMNYAIEDKTLWSQYTHDDNDMVRNGKSEALKYCLGRFNNPMDIVEGSTSLGLIENRDDLIRDRVRLGNETQLYYKENKAGKDNNAYKVFKGLNEDKASIMEKEKERMDKKDNLEREMQVVRTEFRVFSFDKLINQGY